jgi:hypothetical protein
MAHVQQQILDAVKTLLIAAATAAASRVFLDRVDPLQPGELPALLIEESPDGETSEPYTIHGLELRSYQVDITCAVSGATGAATAARDLGLQVEKAIATSTALANLSKEQVRIVAARMTNLGEGDTEIAARQQRWLFGYLVRAETPDVVF